MRLRRGPAQLHLSEHRLDGGPASHVYLYVEDVDSSLPPGAAAGDRPWGMREAIPSWSCGFDPVARCQLLSAALASCDSTSSPAADRSLRKRFISWKPNVA